MKTAEELIEAIRVNAPNLYHIAETGKINGSLHADLKTTIGELLQQNADLLAKVSEQEKEIERLREERKELVEALTSVLRLIDDGVLVRDISKDHESGWAIKQLPLIQTLGKAKSLLNNQPDENRIL